MNPISSHPLYFPVKGVSESILYIMGLSTNYIRSSNNICKEVITKKCYVKNTKRGKEASNGIQIMFFKVQGLLLNAMHSKSKEFLENHFDSVNNALSFLPNPSRFRLKTRKSRGVFKNKINDATHILWSFKSKIQKKANMGRTNYWQYYIAP